MNNWNMSKEEMEQALADKLNEIVDLFNGWRGYDASKLMLGISDDKVYGYIYLGDNEKKPIEFWKERKARRATGRLFTPELGEIIGKAVKDCLIADNDNPLNWASNEGVELLRQKLVFMLQQHDFMLDLKESQHKVTIEPANKEGDDF